VEVAGIEPAVSLVADLRERQNTLAGQGFSGV
jgi:hypothetical protein